MKKRIIALAAALAMLLGALPSYAYTVRDAYSEINARYPEFIASITDQGVSEGLIIEFLSALQRRLYLTNRSTPITEENFEDYLIDAVINVSSADKYIPIQTALALAYPDAIIATVAHNKIPDEFMPIYEVVRAMVFEYNMLEEIDQGDKINVTKIIKVTPLDPVSAAEGEALVLPEKAETESDLGSKVMLDIEWSVIPSTSEAGSFTAEGSLVVPDGFELDGVSETITVSVTVSEKEEESKTSTSTGSTGGGGGGGTGGSTGGTTAPTTENTGTTTPADTKVVHKYNFTDVSETTEMGKAVYALTDLGIINGYLDSTYKPENNITRAEFAKIMVTAMDNYDIAAAASFTDVAPTDWFHSYVASAAKAGLVNGYPDGSYAPNANISRAEVMTVIYRALSSKKALKAPQTAPAFHDDGAIPEFAKTAVYELVNNGIVSGTAEKAADGTEVTVINAGRSANRGDCAVMVYNALKAMGKIK